MASSGSHPSVYSYNNTNRVDIGLVLAVRFLFLGGGAGGKSSLYELLFDGYCQRLKLASLGNNINVNKGLEYYLGEIEW